MTVHQLEERLQADGNRWQLTFLAARRAPEETLAHKLRTLDRYACNSIPASCALPNAAIATCTVLPFLHSPPTADKSSPALVTHAARSVDPWPPCSLYVCPSTCSQNMPVSNSCGAHNFAPCLLAKHACHRLSVCLQVAIKC